MSASGRPPANRRVSCATWRRPARSADGRHGATAPPRRATNLAALLDLSGASINCARSSSSAPWRCSDNGEMRVSRRDRRRCASSTRARRPTARRGARRVLGSRPHERRRSAACRLSTCGSTFGIDPEGAVAAPRAGHWRSSPARSTPATPPRAPSLRNIVLFPARYRDQKVTVVGQFAGRNLLGDLPDAPARSRYDFVLRSADAAIWVTQPASAREGLRAGARRAHRHRALAGGDRHAAAGPRTAVARRRSRHASSSPKPPSEINRRERRFACRPRRRPRSSSAPRPTDETDVSLTTNLRIQFSRDIDPATLKGRLRVSYAEHALGDEPARRSSSRPSTAAQRACSKSEVREAARAIPHGAGRASTRASSAPINSR